MTRRAAALSSLSPGRSGCVGSGLLTLLALLLQACTEPAFTPPSLQSAVVADGLEVRVPGDPDQQVTLVLNRPWSGEHPLFAGLVGLRCDPVVMSEDQRAGAGIQPATPDSGGRSFTIPAATLRTMPMPAVLQALVIGKRVDGTPGVALSTALMLERRDGAVEARPYSVWWGLGQRGWALAALLLGPALALALLRRSRRLPGPRTWAAILAAFAAASVIHRAQLAPTPAVEAGDSPPPLFCWPQTTDRIDLLERHYGAGVGELVVAIADAREPDDVLWIVMGPQRPHGREMLAAHLAWMLRPARLVDDVPPDANSGLVLRVLADPDTVRLAAARAASTLGVVAVPALPVMSGTELARNDIGVLLRPDGWR